MATRMSDEEAKQRREAAHRRKAAEQAAKQSVAQAVKEKISANKTTTLKRSPLVAATKNATNTKRTSSKTTSKTTSSKTTAKKSTASSSGTFSMKKATTKKRSPLAYSPMETLKSDIATGNTLKKQIETAKASGLVKGDHEAVQESKKQQAAQRLKAKQEQAKQKLSKYDSTKLNKTGKQQVREAKVAWGVASEMGDTESMERAHQKAESARSYSGYSGGADGSQYIRPDMGWAEGVELNKLTYEGQRQMNKARMDYYNAQQAGDKAGMEKATQRMEEIRTSNGLLAGGTSNTDAYGRPIQDFDAEQEAKRLKSGAESVGKGIAGSLLSVSETGRQFLRNYNRDRWGSVIDANDNQADALRAKLALAEQGEGNPEWGTVQELRNRLAAAEGAEQRLKTERTTVDPNLPGQTLLRESREAAAEATRGLSGADKLLANTVLSMGQTAPGIALSFVPGIGPALGLGLMGAQAAGSKAGELNEQGVNASEAFTRGLISGGIESLTELFPVRSLLKIVKGPGGASVLKNVAKQAGVEATEETASYLANLIVDKYAQDPNAKFSMQELLETAAIGGLSGAAFGGIGSAIGSVGTRGATAPQASAQESAAAITGQEALLRGARLRTEETAPVQDAADPAAEQAPAPRVAASQEPAQTEGSDNTARAQLNSRFDDFTRRYLDAIETGEIQDENVKRSFTEELQALQAEENAILQQERQEAGQTSRTFGTAENHIDNRTAGDMGDRSVKAFQFDHPQLHQYYVEAAQALKQDAEYSLDTQTASRGQGTVVRRSEQLAQAEGLGLTRNQIIQVCDDIIADNGQENYAAAKRVELILDDMLSRGYIPNEGTTEADTKVPANEAYLQAKGQIEGAVNGFDRYKRDNALALELGEVTEDQLRAEYDASLPEGQGAMSPGAAGDFPHWQNQRTDFHPINQKSAARAAELYGRAPVEVPRVDMAGRLTSKTISTLANAGITNNQFAKAMEEDAAAGWFSRLAYTDQQAQQAANEKIRDLGFQRAKEIWIADAREGKFSKDNTALGLTLINNAANSGTTEGHIDAHNLLSYYVHYLRTGAQALQAANMVNKMSPIGQLYSVINAVERMEEQSAERGKPANVTINDALVSEFLSAETQEERNKIKKDIIMDAAAQLPVTWLNRFNAWRYLAMLENPTTHARNFMGNAGFAAVRGVKDVTAAGLERAFGIENRTNAVINRFSAEDRARLAIATSEFAEVEDIILSGGKYTDDYSLISRAQDPFRSEKPILKQIGKFFSWNAKMNAKALDFEDKIFSKPAYARSLAAYLKANNVTAEEYARMKEEAKTRPSAYSVSDTVYSPGTVVRAKDRDNYGKIVRYNKEDGTYAVYFENQKGHHATVNLSASILEAKNAKTTGPSAADLLEAGDASGFVEKAQAHAIKEAQKATYRDLNEFSEAVSKLGKLQYSSNKFVKGTGILVEGTLPFKKTPANILARGVEYSPVGLAKGILDMETKVRRGEMEAAEAIDELAAGLTGTGLLVLGGVLGMLGIVTGGASDDDKQDRFDALQGSQNYALEIGNLSITLDWLAPEALPFFVGVEFYKFMQQGKNGEVTASNLGEALGHIAEPMLEMSMLQGLNDLFNTLGSDYPISAAAWTAATSYLTQFIPTVLGRIERLGESTRETTFVDKNSPIPAGVQYLLGNIGNKIPGWEFQQIPYIDQWGQTEDTGNVLVRALNNFLNPAYTSKLSTSQTEQELQRLYDAGFDSVFPGMADKGTKINGEYVTADQWVDMQTERGKTAKSALDNFIGTEQYNSMTDEEKAKFVKYVLDYAADRGKVKAGASADETFARWQEAAQNAKAAVGLGEEVVIAANAYKSVLEENAGDETRASIKQGMFEQWVNNRTDLTDAQKTYIKDNLKVWQMMPADSSAYNKAVAAGYTDPKEIQALFENRKNYDLDGDGSYTSNAEILNYISSATEDPAEREKMWNALKGNGEERSYAQLEKEYRGKVSAIQTAKSRLDEIVSAEKQSAFASAASGADSQKKLKKALLSVDATEEERIAYYNLQSAKRGWKKSWYNVKMN